MNDIQIFENPEFGKVRTVEENGEPWFVGKDVAAALGYSNSRKALIDHVDDEDKGVTKCDTLGGQQNLVVINESGVYSLIFSSKLPTAKKFKRWITSEVLPALRKTGHYEMSNVEKVFQPTRPLTTDDYEEAAKTIAKCHNKRLPIVIDLYRKAGLDIQKLEDMGIENEEDDLVELLNRYTLAELVEMLGIARTSLYYYRKGKVRPCKKRMNEIIRILKEYK